MPINIIDVAGLVPNAHKGFGMGLQFLDDLSQADILIHIVHKELIGRHLLQTMEQIIFLYFCCRLHLEHILHSKS